MEAAAFCVKTSSSGGVSELCLVYAASLLSCHSAVPVAMNCSVDLCVPGAAPQLLCPCKLNKQVDAEMCMASVFSCARAGKGLPSWSAFLSLPLRLVESLWCVTE